MAAGEVTAKSAIPAIEPGLAGKGRQSGSSVLSHPAL
jgi:hypothetical protein